LGLSKTLLGTIENHSQYRTNIYIYMRISIFEVWQGVYLMKDRKLEINNIIKNFAKNKSLPYSAAITKIKKDRKGYFQTKDIKQKSKSLSTDRFQQYLKDIQENDTE
jgi:hypothetical protein